VLTYLSAYDFGYTWPWTHGHLVAACALALIAWFGRRRLPKWVTGLVAGLAVYAFAGFLVVQLVLGYNSPMTLPVDAFMAANTGEVLDIGCGSGRATIMVGQARPGIRLAALDNFSAQYIRNNGEDLLRRNLRAAGIKDDRVRVLRADMRKIPARDAEFDGVVSSYAIDHQSRAGIRQTLSEVNRVLKPGGEFLLLIINADAWLKFTYAPLLVHAHLGPGDPWRGLLEEAGFRIVERGHTPGSAHFLCRRP
jgi:SAM-dependent methyltransferase